MNNNLFTWLLLMTLRLILCCLLCFMVRAGADGGFKYEVLKPVAIPQQLAVLSHREGKETLTIWNTVKAESQELAWVLPLPAVPELIQETHPAALRMLQMVCAPPVIAGGSDELATIFKSIPLCFLLLCGAWLMLSKRPMKDSVFWVILLNLILVFSLFSLYLQGKIMGGGGTSVAGVKVLLAQTAGNYETTVISGDSAEQVNQWLTSQGFTPFEGVELKVVGDYISEKWVFLCAKVKTGAKGLIETHPVTVRFPVAQPVYPMRLTAGAGTVPVDLYTIGNTPMVDPGGRLKPARIVDHRRQNLDRTRMLPLGQLLDFMAEARAGVDSGEAGPMFDPNYLPFVPAGRDALLDSLMACGSQITHLQGTFSPGSDWSDITLMPADAPSEDTGTKLYTWVGLIEQKILSLGWLGALTFLLVGFLARLTTSGVRHPHPGWPMAAGLALLVAFLFLMPRWNEIRIADASNVVEPGNKDNSAGTHFKAWLKALAAKP